MKKKHESQSLFLEFSVMVLACKSSCALYRQALTLLQKTKTSYEPENRVNFKPLLKPPSSHHRESLVIVKILRPL